MAEPSNPGKDSIWLYNPSLAASVLFAILYLLPLCVLFWQTILKYRSWFFGCVVFGAALEVGGYIARIASIKLQTAVAAYAVQQSLIVLAPVFVAAGNYLLIGRLIRTVLLPSHHRIHRVPAKRITQTFVLCDVLSFLIQVSGSGIAASGNWEGDTVKTGTNVLVTGLATQVATFVFYLIIVWEFWRQSGTNGKPQPPEGWRKVLVAIVVSSSMILIRSIYRLIEFAMGIHGYLFTHEWIFYVFESLPMLPAIAIFCFYHPARFLGRHGGVGKVVGPDLDLEQL